MPHVETFVNGIWLPSVSTIIGAEEKPWLVAWRNKWGHLAERKTAMANKVGTEFHRCVEEYLNAGSFLPSHDMSLNMAKRISRMMASFIKWAKDVNGEIFVTELHVISHKYAYAGTLDAVGTLDKKPLLYDWKTGSRIYPEMNLQLVAYAQAYKEQTGIELKQGMIVHVSKDKPHYKLTTRTFKLGKRALNKFLKLRAAFDDIYKKGRDNAEAYDSEAAGC